MTHNSRTKANGELAIRQLSTLAQIAYDDETINVYGDDGIYDVDGLKGLTLEQLDKELSARVDMIAYSYHFQDDIEEAVRDFYKAGKKGLLYMTMRNGEPVFDNQAGDVVICENTGEDVFDDWDITAYDVFCEFINRMEGNKMKYYRNLDTGVIWSEDEIRKEYDDFKSEMTYSDFEDYMNEMLRQGREKVGGLVEVAMQKYEVDITYHSNGATSAIDTITAPTGYTAEDYISDCQSNADDDWNEMLTTGDINLVEIG